MQLKQTNRFDYFVVLLAALILYSITCAPGLVWQDSGMIQYRTLHNDIEGGLGLALSHPLFYFLTIAAKYLPFGQFAHKINLVSAVVSAIAVANLYLLICLWLKSRFAALIAALTLALSHTFWRHATIPETYNLYTMLLLTELIFLYLYCAGGNLKNLYCLALVNGLSISTHMLGSLPFVCYAIFFIYLLKTEKIKFRHLLAISSLWLIGAAPYLYLILKNIISTGDFTAVVSSALFGNGWQNNVLNASMSKKILLQNILFTGLNFPTPNIILAIVGLYSIKKHCRQRNFAIIIIVLLIAFLIFAGRYTVPDRYAFFIPFYTMLSILIGAGTYHITHISKTNAGIKIVVVIFALLTIPAYILAPKIAEKSNFNLGTRNNIPYRNDYQWFLQPWRTGYKGADKFASEALNSVEPNSVIFADGTTAYPLMIKQETEGIREDVSVLTAHRSAGKHIYTVDDAFLKSIRGKNLYTTGPDHNPLKAVCDDYKTIKSGLLWKLAPIDPTQQKTP